MSSIYGLVARLRKEASHTGSSAASSSSQTSATDKTQAQSNKGGQDSSQLDDSSSLGSEMINPKQRRHQERRDRQRLRKGLGSDGNSGGQPESSAAAPTEDITEQLAYEQQYQAPSYPLSASYWFKVTQPFQEPSNFLKGAKWSPTGDRIATNSEDSALRVFHCPGSRALDSDLELRDSQSLTICQADCIYDYAWYPYSNLEMEGSSLIALSARGRPLQLWDAINGTLRASYRAYNHLEQICTPNALCFSSDASSVIAGFFDAIRIFPLDMPGTTSSYYSTTDQEEGLRLTGLISTIAVNPTQSRVFAAGSFDGSLVLYDEGSMAPITSIPHDNAGISQVLFTPSGDKIITACRSDNKVRCFDLRMPALNCLWQVERVSPNHQRIGIDIDPTGSLLASGSQDHQVKLWDLAHSTATPAPAGAIGPFNDTVNCFQFHPYYAYQPFWCLGTGQRRPDACLEAYESSDDSSDDDSDSDLAENQLVVGYWQR